MTNPIWVAIDTPDLEDALTVGRAVVPYCGGLKLGLEFFCAEGQHGVRQVEQLGRPVFLDLKLHDIPNTVAKAVSALRLLEPAILTVHTAGGRAMMEEAKAAAHPSTKVVGVTVLTSLDDADLAECGVDDGSQAQVLRLAQLAKDSGLDGLVCSGAEVTSVRAIWADGFLITPGVRPAQGAAADQKRVVTPRQALDAGASALVIGRPITQSDDPRSAIRVIESEL